jgi:hypothetical protein
MYQVTGKKSNEVGHWEDCNAKSLKGAKIAATQRFGGDYDVILVAEVDTETGQRHVLAERSESCWYNLHFRGGCELHIYI